VLARATLNGLEGRVVARGPPVAHPCFRTTLSTRYSSNAKINIEAMGVSNRQYLSQKVDNGCSYQR